MRSCGGALVHGPLRSSGHLERDCQAVRKGAQVGLQRKLATSGEQTRVACFVAPALDGLGGIGWAVGEVGEGQDLGV